jgi:hypothetical protein
LHEGVQELPLGSVDKLAGQSPMPPFNGFVTVHGVGLHTAVSVRMAPSLLQYREPESVYPLLHFG